MQPWFWAQINKHNAIETAIPPETSWGLAKGDIWKKPNSWERKEENTRGKRQVLLTGLGLFRKRINKEKPHHKQHQSRSQVKATLKVLSKIIRKHQDKWLFQTEIIQLCSPSLVKTSVYYTQSVSLGSVHIILLSSSVSLGYVHQQAKYIFYWSL